MSAPKHEARKHNMLTESEQGIEAVLVAADRLREAYEAMLHGEDIGWLPDWQPRDTHASLVRQHPLPAAAGADTAPPPTVTATGTPIPRDLGAGIVDYFGDDLKRLADTAPPEKP